MLQSLDMRTVLLEGAFVCFTLSGIMIYHSVARKTYPGFHFWTAGFMSVGVGAILIAMRGNLPDFLSIIVANILITAMPILLASGLAVFLEIKRKLLLLHAGLFAAFTGILIWATYIVPSIYVRIICFCLMFLWFFGEALVIAFTRLPARLGSQNWLLITMICFSIIATGLRLMMSLATGHKITFLVNAGDWQCASILLTVLSMVGLMASLIILNAQRMELELKAANKKIEDLANQDGLTNLFNRRYFDKKIAHEFQRLQRSAHPLSLIMGDIDYFKNFNDTYGHQAGDDCIKAIAAAFRQSAGRISDIAARYGGEEFVLLLPNTGQRGARKVASQLHALVLAKAIPHASSTVAPIVTISIGVATIIPSRAADPEMLLKLADQALYASKSNGRNQIRSTFLDTLTAVPATGGPVA